MKNPIAVFMVMMSLGLGAPAVAADAVPMDRVYQGSIRLPDFSGRDRAYANYRTRITNEMRSGPNFAGHYAIVEIGCGTSCRFAFVADVATGQVFGFPYGGENYYSLQLNYSVKSNYVSMKWVEGDDSLHNSLEWTGSDFKAGSPTIMGPSEMCG